MKTIVVPEIEQLPEPSFLRVRVHSLRFQTEWLAADAYARATGEAHWQRSVKTKLMTLVHESEVMSVAESYRVVRLAQYVYRRASDVLHGRSTLLAINALIVEDWERLINDLEKLHRTWRETIGQAPS